MPRTPRHPIPDPSPADESDLLTTRELAARLKISYYKANRLATSGRLPSFNLATKDSGRRVLRFSYPEVLRRLRDNPLAPRP